MLLELRFPPGDPAHPPFVRVLAPRFLVHTGHVTVCVHEYACVMTLDLTLTLTLTLALALALTVTLTLTLAL